MIWTIKAYKPILVVTQNLIMNLKMNIINLMPDDPSVDNN